MFTYPSLSSMCSLTGPIPDLLALPSRHALTPLAASTPYLDRPDSDEPARSGLPVGDRRPDQGRPPSIAHSGDPADDLRSRLALDQGTCGPLSLVFPTGDLPYNWALAPLSHVDRSRLAFAHTPGPGISYPAQAAPHSADTLASFGSSYG